MTTPDGQVLQLLARQDQTPVTAVMGQAMGDGFVVVAVNAGEVRLRNPAYSEDLVISIPVPPPSDR